MDQLNTHKSASLVEWVAKQCQSQGDLGKKGVSGILKNMESRASFLQDTSHRIRFIYTPKHASWLNQIECWFSILVRRLIKRKGKKDFIAPMIFTGSLDAEGFEGWLSTYLLSSLKSLSILIMDNAPIHRKNIIKKLVEEAGHIVVFLPKYSPDLNDIEHDFSALIIVLVNCIILI